MRFFFNSFEFFFLTLPILCETESKSHILRTDEKRVSKKGNHRYSEFSSQKIFQFAMGIYFLYFFLSVAWAKEKILGVPPDLLPKYRPLTSDSTKWACLNDSSVVIDFTQINDGICDCPDGSDEPGTNVCPQASLFYCSNEGFAPKYILNHKINDGVCDCCDCSDEYLHSVFSSGSSCEELGRDFNEIIVQELSTYENGMRSLNKIQKKRTDNFRGLDKGEQLKAEVISEEGYLGRLEETIATSEVELSMVENAYHEKLKVEAPELYRYEKLNVPNMSSAIHAVFSDIELLSKAYLELRSILNTLEQSRNRKLRDAVVIANMQRFDEVKKSLPNSFSPDAALDAAQRDQIVLFLNQELPAFFFADDHRYSPDIIMGKLKFVKTIIDVKLNTKDLILETIPQLRSIMEDIIKNHDINYQDPAVKSATENFMAFLTKYEALAKNVSLNDEFWKSFSELVTFVEKEAPSVRDGLEGQNFIARLISFPARIGSFSNSFTSYRSQIVDYRRRIENLKSKLSSSSDKLQVLRSELDVYVESPANQERKNIQVRELLNSLDEFCVNSELDQFIYQLCFSKAGGRIIQTEDKPGGASVLIGMFEGFSIDENSKSDYYLQVLKLRYPDSEVPMQLTSDTLEIGQQNILIGNLPDMNSGIKLKYGSGDKCWNGPRRSAELSVSCAPDFRIETVSEPSKCSYQIEVKAPFGCDPEFVFNKPDWYRDYIM